MISYLLLKLIVTVETILILKITRASPLIKLFRIETYFLILLIYIYQETDLLDILQIVLHFWFSIKF